MTGELARPVRVRLSGDRDDICLVAGALDGIDGLDVITESAPRRNRHDPGDRVCLTVLVRAVRNAAAEAADMPPEETAGRRCGARHRAWSCGAALGHGGPVHAAYGYGAVRCTWPATGPEVAP